MEEKNWHKAVITLSATVMDAVHSLTSSMLQIALVVDDKGRLQGVITDGDIRRGLLAGKGLDSPAAEVMHASFVAAKPDMSDSSVLAIMRQREIRQMPVLLEDGCLVGVRTLFGLTMPRSRDNWVILMAGGLGSRLRPLTENCPKPLLPLRGRPILETIISQFMDFGFSKFFISVNYMAEMIEDYFGDGSSLGVEIKYLREKEQLGTAGAIGLLPEKPKEPIFVMNGDLLTRVDFPHMLSFHQEQEAKATMAVRNYGVQVPYGVVQVDNNYIVEIEEKPVSNHFINAGIYILEPEVVADIVPDEYLDMPMLFSRLMGLDQPAAAFPVQIGRAACRERV